MTEYGMITFRGSRPLLWSHSRRPILYEGKFSEAKKELLKIAKSFGYDPEEIIIVFSGEVDQKMREMKY